MKKLFLIICISTLTRVLCHAGDKKNKLLNTRWQLSELYLNGEKQTLPEQQDSIAVLYIASHNELEIKSGTKVNRYTWDANRTANQLYLNHQGSAYNVNVTIENNVLTLTIKAKNQEKSMLVVQKFVKQP